MRRNNPLCYQYPTNAQRKGLRTLRGINGQYHFVELISKYINDAKKWHEKSIGEMWTESTAQYLWILLLLPLKNVSLQNSTLLLHPTNWVGFLDNYTCFQKEYMCWMSRLLIEGEQPANSQVSRVVTCAKVNLAPDFSKVKNGGNSGGWISWRRKKEDLRWCIWIGGLRSARYLFLLLFLKVLSACPLSLWKVCWKSNIKKSWSRALEAQSTVKLKLMREKRAW